MALKDILLTYILQFFVVFVTQTLKLHSKRTGSDSQTFAVHMSAGLGGFLRAHPLCFLRWSFTWGLQIWISRVASGPQGSLSALDQCKDY